MKVKRTAENQLNKDAYEADPDDRFAEVPDPGQGMTKASLEVMQRRKIVKVSRRKFAGAAATTSRQPPVSTNPFASTTLAPQPTSTMPSTKRTKAGDDAAKPNNNPFANVALASTPAAAMPALSKPTFSFANNNSSSSAPTESAKSATTFSFTSKPNASSTASSSQPATSSAAGPSLLSTPKPRQSSNNTSNLNKESRELNENLLLMIADHWNGGHKFGDYSSWMKQYLAHAASLRELEEEGGEDEDASNADDTTGNSSATPNNNSQPAPSFSFGASAPAPAMAKPGFSFGGTAPAPASAATKQFSFTTKQPAGAAPAPPPSLSFSFGGASKPSASLFPPSSGVPPAAASKGSNDNNDADDPTSNPDDGKIDKIEHEENTEETVLHEVRAKHLKMENGAWKKYGTGVLRVYKHNQTMKHRMVIRSEIGKVQFNVAIYDGMKFDKVIKDTKKGKSTYVSFSAVEDSEKGLESFMIQVKAESLDKLYDALVKTVE